MAVNFARSAGAPCYPLPQLSGILRKVGVDEDERDVHARAGGFAYIAVSNSVAVVQNLP
jgi:hypothetical protein